MIRIRLEIGFDDYLVPRLPVNISCETIHRNNERLVRQPLNQLNESLATLVRIFYKKIRLEHNLISVVAKKVKNRMTVDIHLPLI